jgi:hypothetical protein
MAEQIMIEEKEFAKPMIMALLFEAQRAATEWATQIFI